MIPIFSSEVLVVPLIEQGTKDIKTSWHVGMGLKMVEILVIISLKRQLEGAEDLDLKVNIW